MTEEKGFILKDKAEKAAEAGTGKQPETGSAAHAFRKANETQQKRGVSALPEINFATFIISLNSSALVHMGILDDPSTGQKSVNLPVAKQTIDIISMLEQKTRGNLAADEEKLIRNILHDLRMMYVRAVG